MKHAFALFLAALSLPFALVGIFAACVVAGFMGGMEYAGDIVERHL